MSTFIYFGVFIVQAVYVTDPEYWKSAYKITSCVFTFGLIGIEIALLFDVARWV